MKIKNAFVVAWALLVISTAAQGHHGFAAHFDPEKVIRIEGVITQFDYINPHGFLHIETQDENGKPQTYVCDVQARSQLMRRGFDESLFSIGDQIVVEGFQARRNPYQCEFGVGYFADGSSYTMRTTDRAQTRFAANIEVPKQAAGIEAIFGKWIRPGLSPQLSGRGPTTGGDSITQAGREALEQFDPIQDNPVMRCEPGSPIRSWDAPGLNTAISQQDGNIYIYHESMDVTRVIHMNGELPPDNSPRTDMGYSLGRYEGDELVIETSHFREGVIFHSYLNSDQMTLEERLSVLENGRLQISWQATEPVFYSQPIRGVQVLQPTNTELIPYKCVPENG